MITTLLFDRDGTLNKRNIAGYILNPNDIETPADFENVCSYIPIGTFKGGLVSNQACVNKGLISLKGLAEINNFVFPLRNRFESWTTQICPHTEFEKCACRKPHASLLFEAMKELNSVSHQTIYIGDSTVDRDAALQANIRYINTCWDKGICTPSTDCAHTLFEAVRMALED